MTETTKEEKPTVVKHQFQTPSLGYLVLAGSFAAGAYHGFMDQQGIPLPKEGLEEALKYAPAIIGAGYSAIVGIANIGPMATVMASALGGALGGAGSEEGNEGTGCLAGCCAGGCLGGCLGIGGAATLGAAVGGTSSGVATLVGYGAGMGTGYTIDLFM